MVSPRYSACWLPGLNDDDADPDEVLASAFEWLDTVPCDEARLVVMNVLAAVHNRPLIATAATRYEVLSPRSRRYVQRDGNAVLAIWPTNATLEYAEGLARNGSLCVIPGSLDDLSHWIVRVSAEHLWGCDDALSQEPVLQHAVRSALDSIVAFDGYNNFLGAGGKENSIRRLRAMIREGDRPDSSALENYVLARGVRSHEGARRLRHWYEGLLAGRRFHDYRRRPI